jgi:DNA-directed RNA polymerase specialized sigma24 family protein
VRVRASNRDADFTAFMSQAGPSLLRTAWLLTGDHHDAQELTQAALVNARIRPSPQHTRSATAGLPCRWPRQTVCGGVAEMGRDQVQG